MTREFQPAVTSFEDVQNDWDVLNRATSNHILLDSGFVASLLRHFANGNVTVGISEQGSPLERVVETSASVAAGRGLEIPSGSHTVAMQTSK